MKKIFIVMIIISLFLGWCSIDWNWEKDTKIADLEKQVSELKKEKENDLFKKKQECIKYKDKMLEMAQKFHSTVYELDEIFYSPTKKSCYFIAKDNQYIGELLLFDYFSNITIAGKYYYWICRDKEGGEYKACINYHEENDDKEYDKILKELKWEQ